MAEVLDAPALASAFGRALREAGVPATPERCVRFVRALEVVAPGRRDELYWAARVTFVCAREQVSAFDRVFAAVFDAVHDVVDHRGDPNATAPPSAAAGAPVPPHRPAAPAAVAAGQQDREPVLSAAGGDGDNPDAPSREGLLAAASATERLRERRLERLTAEELAHLRRLTVALTLPLRRTRRARRGRRGERVDVRATLRDAHRNGGDPVRLARRRRRLRPRRLVVLLDVSGSMEAYARAFLALAQGAVVAAHGEAFVFATRLTRLTRALSTRDAQAAVDRAVAAAPDWSGGTRIGQALAAFNDGFGRRGMARGAVIVIVSDGWERDDPALVAREMEHLGRLAHRIVWVNPRRAAPGYAPLAGGMAAALPFCEAFLSGHNATAIDEVLNEIGNQT